MCYATPAQPKSLLTKLFNATLIQPDFFKLSENDFRGLHLHYLESLRRYHFTLHSHNLTTTLAQPDFYYISRIWFQGSTPAQHQIFVNDTILYITLTQPDFHYIRTTWFQGSTFAQPEILIFILK